MDHNKTNKSTQTVVCCTCGKEFEKENHRINRTKTGKHYCSKECYVKNPVVTQEKTGKEVQCKYCGKIFYKSGSKLLQSKSGNHFCSKQCSAKYLSEQVQNNHNTVCDNCGKTFRKCPSSIGKTNFCCRECWKEYIKNKNDVDVHRKYKKDVCEACGFIAIDGCQLDIHHEDCNKNNNDEDNLKTLCANCHRLIHYCIRENENISFDIFINMINNSVSGNKIHSIGEL